MIKFGPHGVMIGKNAKSSLIKLTMSQKSMTQVTFYGKTEKYHDRIFFIFRVVALELTRR